MLPASSESYRNRQQHRTIVHPTLPQDDDRIPRQSDRGEVGHVTATASSFQQPRTPLEDSSSSSSASSSPSSSYSFVIAADTQIGMTERNMAPGGEAFRFAEVEYSRRAIQAINALNPRPLFCCVCGDLVDMTANVYEKQPKPPTAGTTTIDHPHDNTRYWTEDECDRLQDEQNKVFQTLWNALHPSIALVCVCGNHDVGNRPTPATIQRFQYWYGDDYLAFWSNDAYNIVLNSSLISQPTHAPELYQAQWEWLQQQLEYATQPPRKASHVFIFTHHPWFLYDDMEDEEQLEGKLLDWPVTWGPKPDNFAGFPESYFPIPKRQRIPYLELFAKHQVTACFAGHFHQNLITTGNKFGIPMIITGPLSVVLPSTGNTQTTEPFTRGFRLVQVHRDREEQERQDGSGHATNLVNAGEQWQSGRNFSHRYIPIDDTPSSTV